MKELDDEDEYTWEIIVKKYKKLFDRLINVEYKILEHNEKFDEVFNRLQNNK